VPGGRPRAYDPEAALDAAMLTFWAQGYEGTSMADLSAAMGMSAPSIYAAFGDKEKLFGKVLDHYLAGPGSYLEDALEQPTAQALVHTLLNSAISTVAGEATPKGCLTVHGALAVGPRGLPARRALARLDTSRAHSLIDRLQHFRDLGQLPPDCDPADLARLLVVIIKGLAVQAASGTPQAELRTVAEQMMSYLPLRATRQDDGHRSV